MKMEWKRPKIDPKKYANHPLKWVNVNPGHKYSIAFGY